MTTRTVDVATEADWSFMGNPQILSAIRAAARKLAERSSGAEEEDLYQEGLLYVAVRPEMVEDHPAYIWRNVFSYLRRETGRAANTGTSGHESIEDWEEEPISQGMLSEAYANTNYPEPLVRHLLECMWNGWANDSGNRPDGDMPRAASNPANSGIEVAHRIDIEKAWDRAKLRWPVRTALQLCVGDGLSYTAAAEDQHVTPATISARVERGLSTICAYLNPQVSQGAE